MHSTLSTMALVAGLVSFSTFASAKYNMHAAALGKVRGPPHGGRIGRFQVRDLDSAEEQLELYARELDMDVEELVARGKTMDRIKSIGQKATWIAGQASNYLGKAANVGKKVFGRDELAALEADLMSLTARDAEPEAEPELWARSDDDVYGWDW